jgi:hypothetical protein
VEALDTCTSSWLSLGLNDQGNKELACLKQIGKELLLSC